MGETVSHASELPWHVAGLASCAAHIIDMAACRLAICLFCFISCVHILEYWQHLSVTALHLHVQLILDNTTGSYN